MESNIFEIEMTELDRISKAVDNHDSDNVNKFLDHLDGRVDWLKERLEKTEKEIEALKAKNARSEAGSYVSDLEEINGVKTIFEEFKDYNMDVLRPSPTLCRARSSLVSWCWPPACPAV